MKTLWLEMLGAETRFYDVDGVRTRCIEAGTGEAVIFLHGIGGHAEAFARNIVPLGNQFRAISLDYLGFGLTDKPAAKPEIADYVEHLIGFMNAAGIEKAHLVGESLGGWVAMWTAIEYPDRVGKIVSVCGARLEVETDEASITHARDGLAELQRLTKEFVNEPSPDRVRDRLRWLFFDPDRDVTDELVALRWAIYQQVQLAGNLATVGHSVAVPEGASRTDGLTPDRLGQIKNPTLFLWTSDNPTTTAATARNALKYLPDGSMEVMERCGHWPQWEDAPTFNRIVSHFLSES